MAVRSAEGPVVCRICPAHFCSTCSLDSHSTPSIIRHGAVLCTLRPHVCCEKHSLRRHGLSLPRVTQRLPHPRRSHASGFHLVHPAHHPTMPPAAPITCAAIVPLISPRPRRLCELPILASPQINALHRPGQLYGPELLPECTGVAVDKLSAHWLPWAMLQGLSEKETMASPACTAAMGMHVNDCVHSARPHSSQISTLR